MWVGILIVERYKQEQCELIKTRNSNCRETQLAYRARHDELIAKQKSFDRTQSLNLRNFLKYKDWRSKLTSHDSLILILNLQDRQTVSQKNKWVKERTNHLIKGRQLSMDVRRRVETINMKTEKSRMTFFVKKKTISARQLEDLASRNLTESKKRQSLMQEQFMRTKANIR